MLLQIPSAMRFSCEHLWLAADSQKFLLWIVRKGQIGYFSRLVVIFFEADAVQPKNIYNYPD